MPPRAKKPVTPPEPEFDPFQPDQDIEPGGDEAQTELPPPWEVSDETDVNDTVTNEKAKVIVVGNGEGKVVTTIKGGRDYDEPWIVFHSDTLEEAIRNVTDYENLGILMDAAQKASKKFRDLRPTEDKGAGAPSSQGGSQTRSQGRPPAATDGPLGPQHCKHGQKKFWSKFDEEKKELVQIYFCPAPKGAADKCKNQYVN